MQLLPFFIEWSADTIHPSIDSPHGCALVRFEAFAPDAESRTVFGNGKPSTWIWPSLKSATSAC